MTTMMATEKTSGHTYRGVRFFVYKGEHGYQAYSVNSNTFTGVPARGTRAQAVNAARCAIDTTEPRIGPRIRTRKRDLSENPVSNGLKIAIALGLAVVVGGVIYFVSTKSASAAASGAPQPAPTPTVHGVGGGTYSIAVKAGDTIVMTLPAGEYAPPTLVGGITLVSQTANQTGNVYTFAVASPGVITAMPTLVGIPPTLATVTLA